MITALFALLASGLGNAAVAQISDATGAGDERRARTAARQAILVGVFLSLASVTVGLFATPLGETFMQPAAREPGTAFLRIMALGGFGTIFMVVSIGILRARGDSMRPLILIAIVSVATLVLEMAFVLGWWGLEPSGIVPCAWVTVILRGLTGLWGLWMINRTLPLKPEPDERFLDRRILREQLRLGLLSALQQSIRVFGMLALVALSTLKLGESHAASLFVALTVWSKIDIPMIMLAFAWGGGTAPIVGMALGAQRRDHARKTAWAGARVGASSALLNTAAVLLFAEPLVSAFLANETQAIADSVSLLHHVAPVYPFMAFGICVAFAFNGAGDMVRPFWWDLGILLILQSGLAFFLGDPEVLGVTGFFVALTISGVLQGFVPAALLMRRRW
jgi:putative MATE family efflux protein